MVVEFLSPGIERDDLGRFYQSQTVPDSENVQTKAAQPPDKLEVYERYLRVPHYIVYSRHSQELRYFRLTGGSYEECELQPSNCAIWLTDLEVGLGIW